MAITLQRFTQASSAAATSHTFTGIQVDAGTNVGLLVAFACGRAATDRAISGTPTYNSNVMSFVGKSTSATYGTVEIWYQYNPNTGSNSIAASVTASTALHVSVWVLEGVHQSTAPTFVEGSNAAPNVYTWTSTVNAIIACMMKRGGSPTGPTAGGGITLQATATVASTDAGSIDTIFPGYLIADATSEAPSFAYSGGTGGSNVSGSAQWLEAPAGGSSIAAISSGFHVRNINR